MQLQSCKFDPNVNIGTYFLYYLKFESGPKLSMGPIVSFRVDRGGPGMYIFGVGSESGSTINLTHLHSYILFQPMHRKKKMPTIIKYYNHITTPYTPSLASGCTSLLLNHQCASKIQPISSSKLSCPIPLMTNKNRQGTFPSLLSHLTAF